MAFIGNLVPHRSNTFELYFILMQQSVGGRAALQFTVGSWNWVVGRLREWGGTRWGVSCHTSLDSCWCGGRGTWQRRGHWDPFLEFLPIYHTFSVGGGLNWDDGGLLANPPTSHHFIQFTKPRCQIQARARSALEMDYLPVFIKSKRKQGLSIFWPLPLKWLRSSLHSVIVFLLWIQQKMGRKEKYCPLPRRMRDHSSLSRGWDQTFKVLS